MDSKVRRLAAFLAVSVLIFICAVVAALNPEKTAGLVNGIAGEEIIAVAGSTDRDGQEKPAQTVQNGFVQDVLDENGMIIGSDLTAFQQDETFFDPKKPGYMALLEGREQTLTMMATSVEKDLRILIVDGLGHTVGGHDFYVTLTDENGEVLSATGNADGQQETGTEKAVQDKNLAAFDSSRHQNGQAEENDGYKDLDQDGIIYIGGLKAGDYTVTLKPEEGFEIANESLSVSVKDKLEYRIIDDISALIKTEDEIDATREDTGVKEAGADIDGTEETAFKESDGRSRTGIDVSKWNGDIDWARVKNAGVDFAIIRCGYRGSSSGVLVEDPYFIRNIKGASENGIAVGLYFFTQAVNEVEAVEEASMVLSLCREYKLDYPVFIDTEGAGGNGRADGLGVRERTAVCRAFCETVESEGLRAGVYASRNWWYNNLTASELSPYVTWLAEYRSEPLYTGKYQIWQYTSNGSVDGINGRVDLNISYLGY